MLRKTLAAAIALCAFAAAPSFVLAQDTTTQTQIISVMPAPERDYGMTVYNAIPMSDQAGFINWLSGFTPDNRVLVVRALHHYSVAPNLTAFTVDTTPTMAMPVFIDVLPSTDQPTFTTFWNGLTPDQQTSFVTYARHVYPTTPIVTPSTDVMPSDTIGTSAQPFGITMAAAFVNYLPAAEHDAYMKLASYTPTAELGGMNTWLNTLTPEQAGMCVRALSAINAMGMGGAKPQEGMSDYNVKKLITSQLTEADMSAFESMYSSMNDQQRSTLQQLARDAYNGGLNDIGAMTTTATSL
jgi:hypothetical protein